MNKQSKTGVFFLLIVILIISVVGVFLFLKQDKTKQLDINRSLSSGIVKTFVISGSNFKYNPSTITVNKNDLVKITFKDIDGAHNLIVDEYGTSTKVLGSGKEETIEFIANKLGSFMYYCSLPGHKSNGMVGTLIVN